jgi:alpha-amylase
VSTTTATTSTRTSTSSTSTPSTCPSKVSITFSEKRATNYGDTVRIVGSLAELGSWNAANAPSLSATGYTASNPVWKQTIQLPAGVTFTYKFAIVSSSGAVTWESDPNRSYTVPACQASAEVSATWR